MVTDEKIRFELFTKTGAYGLPVARASASETAVEQGIWVLVFRGTDGNAEFVEASRCYGADHTHIIFRHIIPNAMGSLIVQATLTMASSILSVASLSFLGLGITPPTPEWGSMLSTGKEFMRQCPHLITIPGLAIATSVLSFNLIGDGLRDALDPRLKN